MFTLTNTCGQNPALIKFLKYLLICSPVCLPYRNNLHLRMYRVQWAPSNCVKLTQQSVHLLPHLSRAVAQLGSSTFPSIQAQEGNPFIDLSMSDAIMIGGDVPCCAF